MAQIKLEKMKSQKECLEKVLGGRVLTDGKICIKMSPKGLINVDTKRKIRQCFTDFKEWCAKPDPQKLYAYGLGAMYQSPSGSRSKTNTVQQIQFFNAELTDYARQSRTRLPELDIDYELES